MTATSTARPILFSNKEWRREKSLIHNLSGSKDSASRADNTSKTRLKHRNQAHLGLDSAASNTSTSAHAGGTAAKQSMFRSPLLWLALALIGLGALYAISPFLSGNKTATPADMVLAKQDNPTSGTAPNNAQRKSTEGEVTPVAYVKNAAQIENLEPGNPKLQTTKELSQVPAFAADETKKSTRQDSPFSKLDPKKEAVSPASPPKKTVAKTKKPTKKTTKKSKKAKRTKPAKKAKPAAPPQVQVVEEKDPEVELVTAIVNIMEQSDQATPQQPVVAEQPTTTVATAPIVITPVPSKPILKYDASVARAVEVCRIFIEDKRETAECIQKACSGKWGKVTSCP